MTWLIYSLPRFNRLAAEAAQNALAAQPQQIPLQLQQPAPVRPRPRGILQALLFGNAPAQLVVNQRMVAANGNLGPQQPPLPQPPQAPLALHPLNPLAQVRAAAVNPAAARSSPPPAASAAAPGSSSSSSSSAASVPVPAPVVESSSGSVDSSSAPAAVDRVAE